MPTVITENDESKWNDQTGILYHFPKKYKNFLKSGTDVIYYKGKLKNSHFRDARLTDAPHYFAKGVIGKIYSDKDSSKGDLFATIEGFTSFEEPVLAKQSGDYLEVIPDNLQSNYWRNGVRPISDNEYNKILSLLAPHQLTRVTNFTRYNNSANDYEINFESLLEGKPNLRYVTTYERNYRYRQLAIAIHGLNCAACGFNFEKFYGSYAAGYIHIHHINPVSEFDSPKSINPETDLIPLCANCHSVIHRKKNKTITIKELIQMINSKK